MDADDDGGHARMGFRSLSVAALVACALGALFTFNFGLLPFNFVGCLQGLEAWPSPRREAPVGEKIACQVIEANTSKQLGIALVVFRHGDASNRARLGALLREQSGASVQFQTRDGQWHSATVLRLKSCFGRGLLLFPAGTAQLSEKDGFALQFSSGPVGARGSPGRPPLDCSLRRPARFLSGRRSRMSF